MPLESQQQQHPLDGSGVLAQILITQGDILRQLAVMSERLSVLPDHESRLRELAIAQAAAPDPDKVEQRLRKLEQLAARAVGWAVGSGVLTGGTVGTVVGYFHK